MQQPPPPPPVEIIPPGPMLAGDKPPIPKLSNYLQGKGMSQSYMNFAHPLNTLLAEFLKQNVTIPGVMEEIDLTKDDAEKRKRARQNPKEIENDAKNAIPHTKITTLPMPPLPFTAPTLPPLPVAPPLPEKQNDVKRVHKKPAVESNKMRKPPSPKSNPQPSTSRAHTSIMSLPLPQTSNDTDDFISYSPASPITPPPKTTKKGIMDLPLPPGKYNRFW